MKTPKLNKSQLLEFASSGISTLYAETNCLNITKKLAPQLLGVSDEISRKLKGSALSGGWADKNLNFFKPKTPRTRLGDTVKYENLAVAPSLIEVGHPDGISVSDRTVNIVEGFKKAVSVAEQSGCRTFAFAGLSVGVQLLDQINSMPGSRVNLILDNDNSITAVETARSLVRKLRPGIKIALFRGFKGIDDAIANGVDLAKIPFVDSTEWSANWGGYQSGNKYVFHAPQFQEVAIPVSVALILVQGSKGTGKTWYMERLALQALAKQAANIFVVTHRIALSRANAKRLTKALKAQGLTQTIPYIEDESYQGSGSAGLCIDSLLKIPINDFIGATLFIDEITQVLDHLINANTLKGKRSAIYLRLKEILRLIRETGGKVVVADADLDAKSVDLLKALGCFTDSESFTIHNTFEFEKGLVEYSCGIPLKAGAQGAFGRRFPLDVLQRLSQEALAGKRIFVATMAQKRNSKYSTQCLEAWLILLGVPSDNICRIDSETIGDPDHPAFKATERIDEICAKFQIVIASPSLGTGVDIQYRCLDFIFGIFTGVVNSNGARQFLGRPRDWLVPRIIYAPNEVHFTSDAVELTTFSELRDFISSADSAFKSHDLEWFEEIRESGEERLFENATKYVLSQTREKICDRNEYARRIKQGLMLEGYNVVDVSATEINEADAQMATELYRTLNDVSEALTAEERLAREEAPKYSDEDAQKAYNTPYPASEDKNALTAYEIRKQLDLEPTVELQAALDEGARNILENNFAASDDGFEITKHLADQSQYWAQEKSGVQEVASDFIKRNTRLLRVEALKKVNFFETVTEGFGVEQATNLIKALREDSNNLKLFNLPTGLKQVTQAVITICQQFGFNLASRKDRKGKRFYTATSAEFKLPRQLGVDDGSVDTRLHIFEHWKNLRSAKVKNWQAFKVDFRKIKLGALLDEKKVLPALSDQFKYAKLSTRARTIPLPERPKHKMVDAFSASIFVTWLQSQPDIAIDTETYGVGKKGGLSHLIGQIRLIQFATWDAVWVLEKSDFDLVRIPLKDYLLNPEQRKIGHNLMFDLRFLRKEFGVIVSNCADTMLGSRCLLGDLGAAKITGHSLKASCENFLGIAMDKTEQKSDWGGDLTDSQIEYAAVDAWNTFALYKRLEELCKDPSKLLLPFPKMMAWEAWELENKFLFATQLMEATGYEIDVPAYTEMVQKYTEVRDNLQAKWDLPCTVNQKAEIKRYLSAKYKITLRSINKAAAADHTDIPEILLMQQICGCNALLLQLEAIGRQVAENQGRVVTVFKTLTGTGRTATGATGIDKMLINLQSLAARINPALKGFDLSKLKSIFKTNLIIDLPASHGRISSELSNDEQHLKGYLDRKVDMHCVTAAAVAEAVFPDQGYTAEWIQANKDNDPIARGLRDTAKNTYYGWLNGAGARRIQDQIKSNLQIDANFNACKKALNGLETLFSETTKYGKAKVAEVEANQFIINGIICGWLEIAGTYLSWKLGEVGGNYRVPATKIFACLWSRTESLLMKRSCIRIAEKFEATPEWGAKLQNFIHDEVNCEIGHPDASTFAHAVVQEEFGKICPRTVGGFDPLEKCTSVQVPKLDAKGKTMKTEKGDTIFQFFINEQGVEVAVRKPITNWGQK